MRRRRRKLRIAVTAIFLLLLIGLIYASRPGRSTFTVSPETTYVTGPLDKDGYVDYVTALNERLRGNIKPEENANVLIWQATGPQALEATVLGERRLTMPEEYWQWLGVPPPPEDGDYFVRYEDDVKSGAINDELDEKKRDQIQRMYRATHWPWRAEDEPEIAKWLKRNEKPLALVIAASQCPNNYSPLVPPSYKDGSREAMGISLLTSAQACRYIVAALACRAMLRVKHGETAQAWQDLLACHRLARLVARGGHVIELMVAISLESAVGLRADSVFLEYSNLTGNEILKCLHDLEQLPPMPPVAEKLNLNERFQSLDHLMYFAREWSEREELTLSVLHEKRSGFLKLFPRSVNWDPALYNANRWYDRVVACARLKDRAARKKEMDAIQTELKALEPKMNLSQAAREVLVGPKQRGETIGNMLLNWSLLSFGKYAYAQALEGQDRHEQMIRNLHLAFALAAYHADHSRYPEILAQLAPKYIDQIPVDLFSGKPLNYKLQGDGYLFYSVGDNGIDDGGRWHDDDPPGDDLAVRMPVPEPRLKK